MKTWLLLSGFLVLSSCAATMSRNGTGLLFTEVKDSVAVTEHSGSSKRGESCATNVLGLVSTGDMSVKAAKKSGGIVNIATVDYSQFSVLGLFSKTCTIVHGE